MYLSRVTGPGTRYSILVWYSQRRKKYLNLVGSPQQVQFWMDTEYRKAQSKMTWVSSDAVHQIVDKFAVRQTFSSLISSYRYHWPTCCMYIKPSHPCWSHSTMHCHCQLGVQKIDHCQLAVHQNGKNQNYHEQSENNMSAIENHAKSAKCSYLRRTRHWCCDRARRLN